MRRALRVLGLAAVFSVFPGAGQCEPGLFIEDLSQTPPRPVFYRLSHQQKLPVVFEHKFDRFIDLAWDAGHTRIFFSARETRSGPFRVYRKEGLTGAETVVYQNDIGPFRFLLSPDSQRLALQVMGASAWPTIAVHEIATGQTVDLGLGFSPEWSPDGQKLLYLSIPGSLPTYLHEYDVAGATSTRLLNDSVMEAVYMESPERLLVKTSARSRVCDAFQLWDRHSNRWSEFVQAEDKRTRLCRTHQREIASLPGRQFYFFKEKRSSDPEAETFLVVVDGWGGRLVTLAPDEWEPAAVAVDATHLVVGQDPLYVLSADGAGGRREIPQSGFIRP